MLEKTGERDGHHVKYWWVSFVNGLQITLGTGSFLTINTGDAAHASLGGLVPFVSWRFGGSDGGGSEEQFCYNAEGNANNTSASVEWAARMGLFDDPSESSDIVTAAVAAERRSDDERASSERRADAAAPLFGLCFVPGFHGLTAPSADPRAGAGVIGLTPESGRADVLRAVLESVAFTIKQLGRNSACLMKDNFRK